MRLELAGAVALHRVLDSRPPGGALFWDSRGMPLRPYQKPGGLYVFTRPPGGPVRVECPGFQTEHVELIPQGTVHCFLFPAAGWAPPAGWRLHTGPAPSGQIVCWIDGRWELQLLELAGKARIRARPGLAGGCLLLRWEGGERLAAIRRKEPPDWFDLGGLPPGCSGAGLERAYAARADQAGAWWAALPGDWDGDIEAWKGVDGL